MAKQGVLKRVLAAVLGVGVLFTALPTNVFAAEDAYAWQEGNGGVNQQTESPTVIESESADIYNNILGDDPVNKNSYNVTFSVETNGQQKTWTYPIPQTASGTQAVNSLDFYPTFITEVNAFVNSDNDAELVGWTIYTDGHNTPESGAETTRYASTSYISYVEEDACTYYIYNYSDDEDNSSPRKAYKLENGRDYHFVAQMAKAAAKNIYITTIPSVYYDGREHVALGTAVKNEKKTAVDLRLRVYHYYDDDDDYYGSSYLTMGVDYELSYANNTDASMTLVRDGDKAGTFEKKWTSNAERPKVTVTGIGKYKGFSADVYFDILPADLGASEYRYDYINTGAGSYASENTPRPYTYTGSRAAEVSGIANSYLLRNVKKISPKVTKSFYTWGYKYDSKKGYYYYTSTTNSTVNLVQGKDYNFEIYSWNSGNYTWTKTSYTAPSQIDAAGDYLCLVRGIGNYCGAKYGYSSTSNYDYDNIFNVGGNGVSANPWKDTGAPLQFVVTDDDSGDIAKAKIKIGKKTQKYVSDTTTYGASDFSITVKDKKGTTLTLGTDYTVYFSPIYGHNYNQERSGVTYGSQVSAANQYYVIVDGIGTYFGSKTAGKVKITGINLKAGLFSYKKKVKLGEAQNFALSSSGTSAGLDLSDSSKPGYISLSSRTIKSSKKQVQYAYVVYGSSCGTAVYPAKTLTLKWTRKLGTVDINTAISNGLLKITPGTARFNVAGAFPDLTINYYSTSGYYDGDGNYISSGYRDHSYDGDDDVYDGASINVYIKDYGTGYLNFSAENNKAVGTGKLTVKGSGVLKGSVSFDYTIGTRNVTGTHRYPIGEVGDYYFDAGDVYAKITDRKADSGDFAPTDVVLYQGYRTKDGYKAAEIGTDYYKVTGTPTGTKGIAWNVTASDGTAQGFKFVKYSGGSYNEAGKWVSTYEPGEVDLGTFGLYEKEATINDVKSVTMGSYETVNGETSYVSKDYAVSSGKITDYAPKFTGSRIYPSFSKITMNDGTVVGYFSDSGSIIADYTCGENLTAGTLGTTVQYLGYNSYADTYVYGGSMEFSFDIVENAKIDL